MRSHTVKKRKALVSSSQAKKKKTVPQIFIRTLINKPDEFDVPFNQSPPLERSDASTHASSPLISIPLQPVVEEVVFEDEDVLIPSPTREVDEDIEVHTEEVDCRIQREQAHSLQFQMEEKVTREVSNLMPGFE